MAFSIKCEHPRSSLWKKVSVTLWPTAGRPNHSHVHMPGAAFRHRAAAPHHHERVSTAAQAARLNQPPAPSPSYRALLDRLNYTWMLDAWPDFTKDKVTEHVLTQLRRIHRRRRRT